MPTRISCPECETALSLRNAPAPGKKIKCPECEAIFAPGAGSSRARREPPAPAPRRRGRPDEAAYSEERPARRGGGGALDDFEDDYDDYDDRPRRPRRGRGRRRAGKGPNWGLILGLAGGAVVLIVLVIVLINLLSPDKFTKENFRKLKAGMSKDEVEDILGSPDNKMSMGGMDQWVYGELDISFNLKEVKGPDKFGQIVFQNDKVTVAQAIIDGEHVGLVGGLNFGRPGGFKFP